ncbi:MAG: hypothetical protein A4S09_09230 [Proteobacteria bacterium SG_bin7]|nr:MAG: hypothetical protein A4S09_09230 [Proteobacteria bacterium SG_bin7]
MRHRVHYKGFNRRRGHRDALLRNLVVSLVGNERIRTTLAKAKELRRHVERAITKGKDGTLHARRVLMSKFPNAIAVEKIVSDLSKRFDKRDGGYTRIIRLGKRPGDLAEMAYIEFVDFAGAKAKPDKREDNKAKGKETKADKIQAKTLGAQQRKVARRAEKHRRTLRKLQNQARQVSRELNA